MGPFNNLKDEQVEKIYWEIGDVIEGIYRAWKKDESDEIAVIYFVEHLGWKKNLIVKSIKPEISRDEKL